MLKRFLLISFILSGFSAHAETVRVLFVGNSLTHSPGVPSDPELPKQFSLIAKELGVDVSFDSVTRGGHTLKKHYEGGIVAEKLKENKYDFVVIQGYSIEALLLPKCFSEMGGPLGRPDFLKYAGELLELIKENGATPVLFGTWTYQEAHPWMQEGFMCLRFADDEHAPGEKWFGADLADYRKMLKEGYFLMKETSPDVQIVYVGEKWHQMMEDPESKELHLKLYENDHIHPTTHGTFFNAIFLSHHLLKLDISKLKYKPKYVTDADLEYFKKHIN